MKHTLEYLKLVDECSHTYFPAQPFNYWWWRYKVLMIRIRLADWILPE